MALQRMVLQRMALQRMALAPRAGTGRDTYSPEDGFVISVLLGSDWGSRSMTMDRER